jgi:predicted enzyme related to lactoylglutathione lyase
VCAAILNVTFDCREAAAVAEFWAAVLGYSINEVRQLGNPHWVLTSLDGTSPRLVFVEVPEPKTLKNRVHLDLIPGTRSHREELHRLLGLGATIVDDRRDLDPGGWVVMADPEGNEFCLESDG